MKSFQPATTKGAPNSMKDPPECRFICVGHPFGQQQPWWWEKLVLLLSSQVALSYSDHLTFFLFANITFLLAFNFYISVFKCSFSLNMHGSF